MASSSGKNSYTINPSTTTLSPVENPNTTLSSSPEETRIAYHCKKKSLLLRIFPGNMIKSV